MTGDLHPAVLVIDDEIQIQEVSATHARVGRLPCVAEADTGQSWA